jgi:hypothetical protein
VVPTTSSASPLANLTTGTMYTDLPGAFPFRSFRSMQYIFVAYIYDLNAILVRAMPSKNDDTMIAAFTAISPPSLPAVITPPSM